MATTAIGEALTEAHRRSQLTLSAELLAEIARIWPTFDPSSIDASWGLLEPVIASLVAMYRDRSSGLSLNYLRRFAEAEVGAQIALTPAGALAADELAANLTFSGPITAKKLLRSGGGNVSIRTLEQVAATSMRLSANGGRDSIHATAAAEPRIVGWYRVTDGNPCAFCAMVAGLGVHYASKQTASRTMSGRKYHDRCGCTAEPVFDGTTFSPPAETARFQTLWQEATQGRSGREARLAFRRTLEGR